MSLQGYNDKPALGIVPAYARSRAEPVNGLTDLDAQILKLAGDWIIERDDAQIDSSEVLERANSLGIPKKQAINSVEILIEDAFMTEIPIQSGPLRAFVDLRLSRGGFEAYLETYYPGYDRLYEQVQQRIRNEQLSVNNEIAEALGHPRVVVDHVFDILAMEGLIRFQSYWDGEGGR